jgi:hypothetical protein
MFKQKKKFSDLDLKLKGWNWELVLENEEIGYEMSTITRMSEKPTGNINAIYLNQYGVILVVTYNPKSDEVTGITSDKRPEQLTM